MEFIGTILGFIRYIYTLPFHIEDPYSGGTDWFVTILLGSLIYGITAAVLVPLLLWIYKACKWRIQRQHCQHTECGGAWTTDVSDGTEPYCTDGRPCCSNCAARHFVDATQRRADNEPKVNCVHGHGVLVKIPEDGLVRDVCTICKGVWLDGNELELIMQRMERQGYNRGYSAGSSSGSSSGLAVGIALGTAIG